MWKRLLTPVKKLEIIQPVASLEVDNKLALIPMVIPEILRFFKILKNLPLFIKELSTN